MIRLSAIGSALGRKSEVTRLPLSQESLARLGAGRVRAYSDAGGATLVAMAGRAVRASLACGHVDPASIDAVVLCTSSYWHHRQLNPRALSSALCELGLERAQLFLTSVPGCHNAVTGLRLARGLLRSEGLQRVLVCTCDVAAGDAHRLGDGPSVLGDGAACCLLSTDPGEGYALLGLERSDRHVMSRHADDGAGRQLLGAEWLGEVASVTSRLLRRHGVAPAQLALLAPNNYNDGLRATLAQVVGVPLDKTVPFDEHTGHVWSSDPFLALTRHGADRLYGGDHALLLSTGPYYFGAALLSRLAPWTQGGATACPASTA